MKVYISGPMTWIPDLNRRELEIEALKLKIQGHDPVNPHDLSPDRLRDESDDEYYMRCLKIDMDALLQCDAIRLLTGWENSKGARMELHRALELGLKILP